MAVRRLRTLIAIAEKGSFARAADVVHVSQAAVSQQMKSLEDELRVTLFDRTKRPPELNPLGLALTVEARAVVHAYDSMLRSISDESSVRGQLMLGAVPTLLTGLVPKTVSLLKAAYPELHIRVVPGLSADLVPLVDRNYLDAAIITSPAYVPNHMRWSPFCEERLVVLAPLEAVSKDPLELLSSFPYIRFSRRAWVGNLIDQWLEANKIRVEESMELESLEAISSMVLHNLGVSIAPRRCVPSPQPLSIQRIPLAPNAPSRVLGVMTRGDNANARLVEPLMDALVHTVAAAGQAKVLRPPSTAGSTPGQGT